jgi:hypothetical protein
MTRAGEYSLTDNAYAHLLDHLAHDNFQQLTPELRENILSFYRDDNAPIATRKKPTAWARTQEQLQKLRTAPLPGGPAIQVTELP